MGSNPNPVTHDFSHLQDVFGNVPMVKRYTLLSLFFGLYTTTSTVLKDVEQVLRHGLELLSASIPHLKGHVVFEGKSETSSGRARILPFPEPIPLVIKDLRDSTELPGMSGLKKQGYPFSHLDPRIVVPEEALPPSYTDSIPYQESAERPARVFVVQATFIEGGVILTFASNHTTMDMNGLGQTICLFAKACRGEPFTAQELEQANQPRQDAVSIFDDDYQPGPEADYFIFRPRSPSKSQAPNTTSAPIWSYISFPTSSVLRLKALASQQTIVPYITTNDAISALFWRLITRARSQRLGPNIPSEINRQLSARHLMGLNPGYAGHMTASAHTHATDVYLQPLCTVSAHLRQALQDTETLTFSVRAMATMLTRASDKTTIGYGASLDTERDVILSSYAEIKVCQPETSFGPLLGVADAARRPRANLSPGLVYIMPKDKDGSMAAAVCLREIDMQRMREDPEFKEFAVYLG